MPWKIVYAIPGKLWVLISPLYNYVEKCAMLNYGQEFTRLNSGYNLPKGKFWFKIFHLFLPLSQFGKNIWEILNRIYLLVNYLRNLQSEGNSCRNLYGTFEHNFAKVKLKSQFFFAYNNNNNNNIFSPVWFCPKRFKKFQNGLKCF